MSWEPIWIDKEDFEQAVRVFSLGLARSLNKEETVRAYTEKTPGGRFSDIMIKVAPPHTSRFEASLETAFDKCFSFPSLPCDSKTWSLAVVNRKEFDYAVRSLNATDSAPFFKAVQFHWGEEHRARLTEALLLVHEKEKELEALKEEAARLGGVI